MLPQRYHASMELEKGRVVGSWEVEAVVGRGAMATVYRVRHLTLGTRAALKVLERREALPSERLIREGRAQGSLDHEGVISVLDHLHIDGHAALLLEYVEGEDLARLLARGPLPLPAALDLFRQIASAMAAAHEAGLVHRDLKPSNVLITTGSDGSYLAKVGDFGLVKTSEADLTVTHALVGTPRYMAPEQMRAARQVDHRADLFALGALLYELCCGRPAFGGDDLVALYSAKMGGRYTAPEQLVPDLPAPVKAAISGCLQGSPARRIPSCQVLLSVLDGTPWAPPGDETFDMEPALVLCPACGAIADEELCRTCGASTTLAGRYRLVERLSEGAVTRVWRGLDLKRGAHVLVRALTPGADRETRARFVRGAQVQQELCHPQIARGIDGPFEEHDLCFEVRDWIEGCSLAAYTATHRLSEVEVIEAVLDLCAPLRYLAERTPPVVHRALEPSNLLRTDDGKLVLIDFAQVRDTEGDGSLHDVPAGAPEQWVGEASPKTDIYGLGALAVTLLARVPAHTLPRAKGTIALRPHVAVSDGLASLLLAMLKDDPGQRPDIEEVERSLRALLERARTPQLPALTFGQPAPARAAAGILVGASVALGTAAVGVSLVTGITLFLVLRPPTVPAPPPVPAPAPEIALPLGPSPQRVLPAGPDLARQPVPGARCGPGFDVTISLQGSSDLDGKEIPLYALACDGSVQALGTFAVGGEHTLTLPSPSTLRSPFHTLRCNPKNPDRASKSGDCVLSRPVASTLPLRASPTVERMPLTEEGRPLDRGTLLPSRMARWARGSDGRPNLGTPLSIAREPWFPGARPVPIGPDGIASFTLAADAYPTVLLDGVFRRGVPVLSRSANTNGGYAVVPLDPAVGVSRLKVVDPEGEPIADAEVHCSSTGQALGSQGRTDAQGELSCDPGPGARRWAVVQAPGRVAEVTELLPPVIRVTLREARTLRVGCAGLPDGICSTMETPPSCAGSSERSSGICQFSGDVLLCECSPDADKLVHGILGTAEIPEEGDQVWFDLRSIPGSLEGAISEASQDCHLRLRTQSGVLATTGDEQGRFTLPAVPAGNYALEGYCRGASLLPRLVKVRDEPVSLVMQKDSKPTPTFWVGQAKERPAKDKSATEEVERELDRYVFPAWPAGTSGKSLSCSVKVRISAQGEPVSAEPACPEPFADIARQAVMRWRWKKGDAETTEELLVPFDPDRTVERIR